MADAAVALACRQISNGELGEVGFIGLVDLSQGQIFRANQVVAVLQGQAGNGDDGAALGGNPKTKLPGTGLVVRDGEAFLNAGAVDHVARIDSAVVAKV